MSVRTIASGADFGTNTFVFAVQITGLPSGSTQIPIFYCGNGGTGIGSNNTYLDLTYGADLGTGPLGFNVYGNDGTNPSRRGQAQIQTTDITKTYVFTLSFQYGLLLQSYTWDGSSLTGPANFSPGWTPSLLTQFSFGISPTYSTAPNFRLVSTAYYTENTYSHATDNIAALIASPNHHGVIPEGQTGYMPYTFGTTADYNSVFFTLTGTNYPDLAKDTGALFGTSSQQQIEFAAYYAPAAVACFTATSKILTPTGYKAATEFKNGDNVVTADGRVVPTTVYTTTVLATKETAPYLIPKNSLTQGTPAADMRLSPWHAIQLKKGQWMKPASAAELNPGTVTQYGIGETVTYYHLETPNYFTDNLVCDGTIVESFAGDQLKNVKHRMYTYNSTLKAYTRMASPKLALRK